MCVRIGGSDAADNLGALCTRCVSLRAGRYIREREFGSRHLGSTVPVTQAWIHFTCPHSTKSSRGCSVSAGRAAYAFCSAPTVPPIRAENHRFPAPPASRGGGLRPAGSIYNVSVMFYNAIRA